MSEFWKWLDEAYADGSQGEQPKFTKYNMEVAYAAGRAARTASAEPVELQALSKVEEDTVADRLDRMADSLPTGSQSQSDLYAAATIWRKHLAAPDALQAEVERLKNALEVAERSVENEVKRRNQYAKESDELDRQVEALKANFDSDIKFIGENYSEIEAERDALKEEVERLNQEADENTAEWGAVRLEIAVVKAENERLRKDRKSCWEEFKALVKSSKEREGELKAENERLREEVERLTKANEEKWAAFCSLETKHGKACDERDALKADAERYRWLRDGAQSSNFNGDYSEIPIGSIDCVMQWTGSLMCGLYGEELDAEIDAARTAKPEVDHE
ncbi:hypothetical protein HMPREF1487_04389 [Pseudomonas sp. HPB0071]|uniref:hypothetical protein n=1 Tax=unclassified Pseudomonas TaxID=196821 RepID=UPI0002CA207C|nr:MULTISPECIES: hypothetical protein [unclassified Pseudomonas]ENA37471.1 hypothetical protein HMPREF1487_04389 [Pseudomonas sp. HPB0071]